jgi:RNA polymerase sigma-70 factor (ECF subfamily)
MTPAQINKLLENVIANDCERSFRSLFLGLFNTLNSFAKGILKSQEDAEEVVTDFFMTIWVKRKELPHLENPRLYFLVGVKNMSLNKLKARNKQILPPIEEWQTTISSVFFNPEELMLSSESVNRILSAINSLPVKCRVIFKLIKEDGLKYQEVAELLDISVKTVESQMAIAFRRVKSAMEIKNTYILHN